jgi:hypothetical protein
MNKAAGGDHLLPQDESPERRMSVFLHHNYVD